jgi:mono/diheme cytochrome c family protein
MIQRLVFAALVLAAVIAFGQSKPATPAAQANKNPAASDSGERLFQVNCGRCHRPPDQLSPKIAGSVLRHMRVRAMLSKEDEQQILKYLAP